MERFKEDVANDASLKERSKHYRTICIRKIDLTWPELWEKRINEISTEECKKWAANLRAEIAGQYFNNTVDTLRLILDAAIENHRKSVGESTPNPARDVKACEAVGIPPLRHHDLRHLFATRCIEAGVDIPTVARWLGHKDGGALAMRTYGHLRNEHSQAMAQKVKF